MRKRRHGASLHINAGALTRKYAGILKHTEPKRIPPCSFKFEHILYLFLRFVKTLFPAAHPLSRRIGCCREKLKSREGMPKPGNSLPYVYETVCASPCPLRFSVIRQCSGMKLNPTRFDECNEKIMSFCPESRESHLLFPIGSVIV